MLSPDFSSHLHLMMFAIYFFRTFCVLCIYDRRFLALTVLSINTAICYVFAWTKGLKDHSHGLGI